jgi:hypothetical protein
LFRGSTPTAVDSNEGGRIEWIEGTLAEVPWCAIEAFQPEAGAHTAWITTPVVYLDSPANKEYLHWSLQLGKTLRQIGVSRLAVFGDLFRYQKMPHPMHEERTPLGRVSVYARSKDELCIALEEEFSAAECFLSWCGLIFNSTFHVNAIPYDERYENRQCEPEITALLRERGFVTKRERNGCAPTNFALT